MTTRSISDGLPLAIFVADVRYGIGAFLRQLDRLIDHGMISLDEVTAIRYATPS